MKVVRYSVQEHPDGYAVMEVCEDWQTFGACRYELWCQCLQSAGGPLQSVVKVCGTLADALAVCETLQAACGGDGVTIECDGAKRIEPLPYVGDWQIPF